MHISEHVKSGHYRVFGSQKCLNFFTDDAIALGGSKLAIHLHLEWGSS